MQPGLISPHWHRVCRIHPRLRGHVHIHRHFYRGCKWYLIQDHSSGRFHRFSEDAYEIVSLLDGVRSLDEIWNVLVRRHGAAVMSQDDILQLLAKLHRVDALTTDAPPDTDELFRRLEQARRRRLAMRWRSPLSIRIPLLDPGRLLDRTVEFARPLFSRIGFCIWLATVLSGLLLAAVHWDSLTNNVIDRVLGGGNLLILLATFPVVKVLHEFGHAYAARVMGGEVHEMGVIILVLMPVPYCEASSASAFGDRWHRALVGSAGMLVELFIAAVAMWVWAGAEPGLARAVAFNVMIIAGVSTILFNGNPLIRFDGYYILSDLIEIPNLATRSNQYFGYLVQRYLFGIPGTTSPASTAGEARWFFFYAIASFFYRIFLTAVIVLFLAGKFFVIGMLLAVWAFGLMAVQPIWRQIMFLARSPRLNGRRTRAVVVTAAVGMLVTWLATLPLPLATIAEGVVWVPEKSRVRTSVDGFVSELVARDGQPVGRGDVILRSRNPELESRTAELDARLREVAAQVESFQRTDRVQMELAREQLQALQAQLQNARADLEALTLRSHADGVFHLDGYRDMAGLYLSRGAMVGFVSSPEDVVARVVVDQSRVDLVRSHADVVEVKMAHDLARTVDARLVREVPGASMELPSLVLSTEGGGAIVLDPRVETGPTAFEALFQFDIAFPPQGEAPRYGERVFVKFDHGTESAAAQLYRQVRQVFLKRFDV